MLLNLLEYQGLKLGEVLVTGSVIPRSAGPAQQPVSGLQSFFSSITTSPICISVSGTYQAIINRIDFDLPAGSLNGIYSEAPGASFSTGATPFTLPSRTLFHAIVSGSHQPPRN